MIMPINFVSANEYPEITNDVEIRYKWYKNIRKSEGEYYPLKNITDEDEIDENNVKYIGEGNIYDSKNCSLSSKYYLLEEKVIREYKKTYNTSYVLIENVTYNNNIKIYYDNIEITYNVISSDKNQIKIDLKKEYLTDKLMFFVDTNNEYTISLYTDIDFSFLILSKQFIVDKLSIPNKSWINENTKMTTYITSEELQESDLTILLSQKINCSYKEKYVYKYKTSKEYYDDNYYTNIDNYIKDINDYKIYYKGEPIVNTVEIIKEKIIEIPKIEYIYIETENDSSQQKEEKENIKIEKVYETKIKTIKKEVPKIPSIVYIIIIIETVIVIILTIKLNKKYVE